MSPFKKPSGTLVWITGLNIVMGLIGIFMGLRSGSAYMVTIFALLFLFSCGIWFESRASAIGLIVICAFLALVGVTTMFMGRFGLKVLFRVGYNLCVAVVLWFWLKRKDIW